MFEKAGIKDVIVVVMPANPTAIHLDMLFTPRRPRALRGLSAGVRGAGAPHHFAPPPRRGGVREMPDIFSALSQVAMPLEPVLAAGIRRLSQEREQWASGCNFLATAPA
jgi:arginine deiminase